MQAPPPHTIFPSDEPFNQKPKSQKKKALLEVDLPLPPHAKKQNPKGTRKNPNPSLKKSQKFGKRGLKHDPNPPPIFHQKESSNSDSSTYDNEYRALRRKYIMLEEESFQTGKELKDLEAEIHILEDEKLALLDRLVVMEGLIDSSQLQKHGRL